MITGFALLAFVPGFALYLLIKRSSLELLETFTVVAAISPVIVSVVVSLLLISGIGWSVSIAAVLAVSVGIVWSFAFKRGEFVIEGNTRTFVALVSILVFLAIAASSFHISSAYYRLRGDAWHQGEMVNEILARGVPPLEPTYQGLLPQYYWLYEAYAAIVHKASGIGVFGGDVPHIGAVSGSRRIEHLPALEPFQGIVRPERIRRPVHHSRRKLVRLSVLGAQELRGEKRGWAEISASFHLVHTGVLGTSSFVANPGGYAWIVAKYMHSNPMVIASVLFMLLPYFILRYFSDRKASWLPLSFVSLVGALLFHPISGIVFMAMCGPAAFLVYLAKRKSPDPDRSGRSWLCTPYSSLP